jgi:hypothetical protein
MKPYRKLTYDFCKKEAIKYNTIAELQKSDGSVYNRIRKNGWLELLSHVTRVQKESGYWTYERCKEEALKCKTRAEMQGKTFYNVIKDNKWLEELTSHLDYVCKPAGYWTYERCKEAALKCKTRAEMQGTGFYNSMLQNGWLEELTTHLNYIFYPNGYWTYERCKEEANKYMTTKDFRNNSKQAYNVAKKNRWWDELCSHMKNSFIMWTKNMIHEEALKYDYRSEFIKGNINAYSAAIRNKWIDEVCSHMKWKTTIKERYIYAFEFEDNSAYIGLSYNPHIRKSDHLTKETSKVYIHIQKTGCKFKLKTLLGPVPSSKAGTLEREIIRKYKDNGWNILNIARGGSLGGSKTYWTKKQCFNFSSQFTLLSEFSKSINGHVRTVIHKNGWWDELTNHMTKDVNMPGYWDDEKVCREEASKYTSKSKFQKECSGAYKAAIRNNWLDDMFPMTEAEKQNLYWSNKDNCHKEAVKYKTRTEFSKGSRKAYRFACKNKWIDDICSHMQSVPPGYWTKDKVLNEALKYENREGFRKGSPGAVTAAIKKGWWNEVVKHMKSVDNISWTKEIAISEAYKYHTITSFQKENPKAYSAVVRRGWSEEAFAHMHKRNQKPKGYWDNKEICFLESNKYNHRSEFQDKCSGAYKAAKKNGWLNIMFPIYKKKI